MFPTVAAVPLTAACWVAVWATCPALQPERAAATASPQAARATVTAELRDLKRFTQKPPARPARRR